MLTDCPNCWMTPCGCGGDWKRYSVSELEEFIEMLERVIEEKRLRGDK